MSHLKPSMYFTVTGVIFVAVAIMSAYRAFNGLAVSVGDWTVPVWVSWVALVVAAYLAWSAYQNSNR